MKQYRTVSGLVNMPTLLPLDRMIVGKWYTYSVLVAALPNGGFVMDRERLLPAAGAPPPDTT